MFSLSILYAIFYDFKLHVHLKKSFAEV